MPATGCWTGLVEGISGNGLIDCILWATVKGNDDSSQDRAFLKVARPVEGYQSASQSSCADRAFHDRKSRGRSILGKRSLRNENLLRSRLPGLFYRKAWKDNYPDRRWGQANPARRHTSSPPNFENTDTMKTKLTRYDVAEHLRTPEEMSAYLSACMEEAGDDAAFVAKALGDIARAKGMTQIAKATGLSRESLYKALSGERVPAFDTVLKVCQALEIQFIPAPIARPAD